MPEEMIKVSVERSAHLHPILVECMRKADTHLKVVLVDFFILSNNNSAHPK
jgi:hypothetical protein